MHGISRRKDYTDKIMIGFINSNPRSVLELARGDQRKYETRFLIYMLVQRWDLYRIYDNEYIYKSLLMSDCDEDSQHNRPMEKSA